MSIADLLRFQIAIHLDNWDCWPTRVYARSLLKKVYCILDLIEDDDMLVHGGQMNNVA